MATIAPGTAGMAPGHPMEGSDPVHARDGHGVVGTTLSDPRARAARLGVRAPDLQPGS